MMSVAKFLGSPRREVAPYVWAQAREIPGPFVTRLRDAWAVVLGRADAIYWPPDDDPEWSELLLHRRLVGEKVGYTERKAAV